MSKQHLDRGVRRADQSERRNAEEEGLRVERALRHRLAQERREKEEARSAENNRAI